MNFDIDPRELDLQGADGMQLVRILRRLIAEEGGGGGDEPVPSDVSDFFYCTYDVTTYSEIHNALTQNKIPVCPLDGHYYYLVSTTQSRYTFACYNNVNHSIMCVRCASSGWDTVTFLPQEKLTWDYTPTQGSTNPVTSGGVYTAIKNNTVDPEDIQEAVDAWLDEHSSTIGGLSYEAKQALMDCFENVAWINDDGQEYYDALYDALFGTTPVTPTLDYILAVFNQGSAIIYDDASLDSLRQYLTVTAYYTDETSQVITNYQLAGTLTAGQSVITASYQGQFTTFTVNVTAAVEIDHISAVFTQGEATIWSDDSLNTLKQYLVVTAYYTDQTSVTVNDYTLSGSLNSSTSTITVTYNSKTTTFTVDVTLVGSTNYAGALSNWTLSTTPTASYSNNRITLKYTQTSVYNNNNFAMWAFDCKTTLWSAIDGKKLRIRVTEYSTDWSGVYSNTTPNNRAIDGLALFASAGATSGNDRQKYVGLGDRVLTSTPQTFEYVIDADLSLFTGGSGTPTSNTTFGYTMYNASLNTVIITDLEIVEVLN